MRPSGSGASCCEATCGSCLGSSDVPSREEPKVDKLLDSVCMALLLAAAAGEGADSSSPSPPRLLASSPLLAPPSPSSPLLPPPRPKEKVSQCPVHRGHRVLELFSDALASAAAASAAAPSASCESSASSEGTSVTQWNNLKESDETLNLIGERELIGESPRQILAS